MRIAWREMLAAIVMLSAAQVQAQDAETVADIHCVIVGFKIAQLPDLTQKNAGTMLALYFIGRLDSRVPKLDMEELIVSELSHMTAAEFDSEAKRCGGALSDKGQEFTRIGKDLSERAQKMQK